MRILGDNLSLKRYFIDDYGILIVYRRGKLPRKHEKVPIELSNTLDNTLKFSNGIHPDYNPITVISLKQSLL